METFRSFKQVGLVLIGLFLALDVGKVLAQGERTKVILDPLSSNEGRWSEVKGKLWFEEGAYHVRVNGCVTAFQLVNGVAEVQTQQVVGKRKVGYGLAVRITRSEKTGALSGYALLVCSEGGWKFVRIDANKPTDLVPWTSSNLLLTTENASNTLAVLCNGDQFTIILNNSTAAQVTNGTYKGKGEVGLILTSNDAEIAFRNLKLTELARVQRDFNQRSSQATASAQAEVNRLAMTDELKMKWTALSEEIKQQEELLSAKEDQEQQYQDKIEKANDDAEEYGNEVQKYQEQMSNYQAQGQGLAGLPFLIGKTKYEIDSSNAKYEAKTYRNTVKSLQRDRKELEKKVRQLRSDMDGIDSQTRNLDRRKLYPTAPPGGMMIISHLGNWGPCFAPGLTPLLLGWGGDDLAYPNRIVVNYPDGAEMVWVPAGTFSMGARESEVEDLVRCERLLSPKMTTWMFTDSQPSHPVEITRGFWIYKCEVTADQFRLVKSSHSAGAFAESVTDITWIDAQDYATQVGGSLPSEAQWEYACRAGETGTYLWGSEFQTGTDYANMRFRPGDAESKLALVGTRSPNGFGLLDIAGNAAEWCSDWYDPGYYKTSPSQDPCGPVKGTSRIVRGGSYNDAVWFGACSIRRSAEPNQCDKTIGFRVCVIP